MSFRGEAEELILEALRHHGGRASVTAVAKYVWENHRAVIERYPGALYTWQYDLRWAGQELRKRGLKRLGGQRSWELVK